MGKRTMKENLLFAYFLLVAQQILVSGIFVDYDAYIVNGFRDNSKKFSVHIFSGDDDLGYHNLKVGEKFLWRFKMGLTTKFYGHFWWGEDKERELAVFDKHIAPKCRKGLRFTNICWWLVKEDGFFIANTENPKPENLIKMNWWINKTT